MDDLSTLTPQAKYGVKFIDSVMTLFRQGILKLAWEICKNRTKLRKATGTHCNMPSYK